MKKVVSIFILLSFLSKAATLPSIVFKENKGQWPEKVLFGSDSEPFMPEMNWEETGWLTAQTARKALAIALTGMMNDGEITREQASKLAHMVLRENAIKLYGLPSK